MDSKLIAAYIFAILFEIIFPIVLALYVRRRLAVSWRYFWYGALIFFLFQMITRVPAIQLVQPLLAGPLSRYPQLIWAWIFALALTAGLFEEVGRYLGYRYLIFRSKPSAVRSQLSAFGHPQPVDLPSGPHPHPNPLPEGEGVNSEPRTQNPELPAAPSIQHSALESWKKGVMYGVGHGGLESMLLVGGMALISFVNALALTRLDPSTLPRDQASQVLQLQAFYRALPWWMPLLGAFERFCTMGIQVAFSILVLQCFLRGSHLWLYLAIGAHFLVDFVTVVANPRLGPVATEGIVALFGLAALYLIFRFKPKPEVIQPQEP